MVPIVRHAQLLAVSWHLRGDAEIHERDAFALYEANWRFVDEAALDRRERAFIDRLAQKYGNGLLNV